MLFWGGGGTECEQLLAALKEVVDQPLADGDVRYWSMSGPDRVESEFPAD